MPIQVATAPVSWGVMEVEGFNGQKSYGEVLDEMVQAGYADTERGGMGDQAWEGAARLLTRTARAASELGLSPVFHHHCGTFIETPGEVDRLLAMTDPELLGLCLDTGHYFYGGGDPVECARV